MMPLALHTTLLLLLLSSILIWVLVRISRWGYWVNLALILILGTYFLYPFSDPFFGLEVLLEFLLPLLAWNTLAYGLTEHGPHLTTPKKYRLRLKLKEQNLRIGNLRRGVAITGAAGSGKTESVVYNFLTHFRKYSFCGVIHDYKSFELTEIAYPLFKNGDLPFYIISFDRIYHRVNPIAPRYLPDEESVNELSRVLLENLLELRGSLPSGPTKFFNDAAEGLIAGLIWKLKTEYPDFCSLPHLVSLYQFLDTDSLVRFLSSNTTSRVMADAFISGIASERQTAAVRSTLANALKKISTHRIFMTLSADEVPLDINNPENPSVVSVVNNPKFETAYSPVIATIIHTITKQMSIRNRVSSFLLLEEAPTIRLLNMHRIPATLRSYDIATVYIMQDKIQNELLYGEKASKAILSNLSYQFFGKANDPDTARFYERFFEIVKRKSISTSQGEGIDFDMRITKSDREVSKIRADYFFRLQPGEFVAFADGKEQKIRFKMNRMEKSLPKKFQSYTQADIHRHYEQVHKEVRSMFETDDQ